MRRYELRRNSLMECRNEMDAEFEVKYLLFCSRLSRSTIIPERLDPFINKYAEHTHDKWAFEKVSSSNSRQLNREVIP